MKDAYITKLLHDLKRDVEKADHETVHCKRDALYIKLLTEIAEGKIQHIEDARKLAHAVLTIETWQFYRWYA
jgi:hypothetical protein